MCLSELWFLRVYASSGITLTTAIFSFDFVFPIGNWNVSTTGNSIFSGLFLKSFAKPWSLITVYIISNLKERKKGRKKKKKESPRKEERTKRALKFKLVELWGLLSLPWFKGLPLTFMTMRSSASRTHGLCAQELVTGWPRYLWISLTILGSTLWE